MKVVAYVRVARPQSPRGRTRIMAAIRPTSEPIYTSGGEALPTVAFALELELDEAMFARASKVVAKINVDAASAKIAATAKQP